MTNQLPLGTRASAALSGVMSFNALIFIYWAAFWIMNGLDKFLKRTALLQDANGQPLFTWFGKDRTEQFTTYFDRLSLDTAYIDPLLQSLGVMELLVGSVCVLALMAGRKAGPIGELALKLTLAIFIAFSIGDVLIGDRAELLEHGTYMIMVAACYIFVALRVEERGRAGLEAAWTQSISDGGEVKGVFEPVLPRSEAEYAHR